MCPQQYFLQLGAKPGAGGGPFSAKPPFWERPHFVLWTAAALDPAAEEERLLAAAPDAYKGAKGTYDRSRRTVTRTGMVGWGGVGKMQ
jgi:L-ascorbate peroxidase